MATKRSGTYKIGITGNICTGKSLVRSILQRRSVNTFDSEEAALAMLADNPKKLSVRITEDFGTEVVDHRGRLIRRKLLALIYSNADKRKVFEEKVFPALREETKKFLYSPMGSHIRAVEAPMLFESDTQHLYDEVWLVTTTPEVQIKRLIEREHMPKEQAELMLAAQMPQDEKIEKSRRVIDNSLDSHHTETQVIKLLDEIKYLKVGI